MRRHRGAWGIVVAGVLALAAAGPAAAQDPGRHNAITDVPGVTVGQKTDRQAGTGTTALIMPEGALMGASPSGGAPGNRVTTLLRGTFQDSMPTPIYGMFLNGGSIFGLQAACGVVQYLQERDLGLPFGGQTIPLVPGAIIFDLGRGRDVAHGGTDRIPKECSDGYAAASAARGGRVQQGSVGAGTGARSGGVKGGLGTASTVLPDGTVIGALVVVNSSGRPYNPDDGCELYTLWAEKGDEFGGARRPPNECQQAPPPPTPRDGENTTIGVIATNASLTAAQVERLSQLGEDGFARAIRPAHTPGDGDTLYAMSTAENAGQAREVDTGEFRTIGAEAGDVYARAITKAILNAKNVGVAATYCETFPGACEGGDEDAGAAAAPPAAPPASARPVASGGSGVATPILVVVGLLGVAAGVAVRRLPRGRRVRGHLAEEA